MIQCRVLYDPEQVGYILLQELETVQDHLKTFQNKPQKFKRQIPEKDDKFRLYLRH